MPVETAQRTVEAWKQACDAVGRICFDHGSFANLVHRHGPAYEAAKSRGLSAHLAQFSIRRVASRYAAMRSNGTRPHPPCLLRGRPVILQDGKRARDVSLRRSGPCDLPDKLDS
jgi:hypothetical protein